MAEYYTVERSSEYLAHYGIKGMRWGVRKAIASGNSRALGRQYRKAQKKLSKLNARADLDYQKAIAKKYGKIAKISGSIGAAGAGIHVGSMHLQKRNWNKFDNETNSLYNWLNKRTDGGLYSLTNKGREEFVGSNRAAHELYRKHLNIHDKLNNAKIISAGIGAAGLGIGAVTGAKALSAKLRTTTGGHAAAVAKRNEFQREMNKAFKGTKYANAKLYQPKKQVTLNLTGKKLTKSQRKNLAKFQKSGKRIGRI